MERKAYPTDISDKQWHLIADLVPDSKVGGRPEEHARRELINAIRYHARSGSGWRMLPHDFPPWQTVYHYFRLWTRSGVWKRVHDRLH